MRGATAIAILGVVALGTPLPAQSLPTSGAGASTADLDAKEGGLRANVAKAQELAGADSETHALATYLLGSFLYLEKKDPAAAEPVLIESAKAFEAIKQTDDVSYFLTQHMLGSIVLGRNDAAASLVYWDRAWLASEKLFASPEKASERVTLLEGRSNAYQQAGKAEQALAMLEEALALQQKLAGESSAVAARLHYTMALVCDVQLDNARRARQHIERCLKMYKDLGDQQSTGFTNALLVLAELDIADGNRLLEQQQYEGGVAKLDEALDHRMKALGQADARSATLLQQVAWTRHRYLSQTDQAIDLQQKCLTWRRELFGEVSEPYFNALGTLGTMHRVKYYQSTKASGGARVDLGGAIASLLGGNDRDRLRDTADATLDKMVAISGELFGAQTSKHLETLRQQADFLTSSERPAAGRQAYEKALGLARELAQQEPQQVAFVLSELAKVEIELNAWEAAANHLQEADALLPTYPGDAHWSAYVAFLESLIRVRQRARQPVNEMHLRLIDAHRQRFGADSADYAQQLRLLAVTLGASDMLLARECLEQASAIYARQSRPDEASLLECRLNMARIAVRAGRPLAAIDDYNFILSKRREQQAPPDQIEEILAELGGAHVQLGNLDKAQPLFAELRAAIDRGQPKNPFVFFNLCTNVGMFCISVGDMQGADRCYRQAEDVMGVVPGGQPLQGLARLMRAGLASEKDSAEARRLFELARPALAALAMPDLKILERNIDALLLAGEGKWDAASAAASEALTISAPNQQHVHALTTHKILAKIRQSQGDFAEAERAARADIAASENLPEHGADHVLQAASYQRLGYLRLLQEDPVEALACYRRSLDIREKFFRDSFAALPERQQLSALTEFRSALDEYLSLPGVPDKEAYERVLQWKGLALAYQRLSASVADSAPLRTEVAEISSQIARLLSAPPADLDVPARVHRMQQLAAQREDLQVRLARSAVTRVREPVSASQVQAALPAGAVLVDYLVYQRTEPPDAAGSDAANSDAANSDAARNKVKTFRALAVFVLSREGAARRVELGPADPIEQSVAAWRGATGADPATGEAPRDYAEVAAELRSQIWQPLESHARGARAVFYSPDGFLGRFPLGALPGQTAGTFLIEEVLLTVIPVAALLVESNDAPASEEPQTLVLVGNVDYDARATADNNPPEAATGLQLTAPRGEKTRWPALAGSNREIAAIEAQWREQNEAPPIKLSGETATEANLRQSAPRARYLHLATHGFFDPAGLRSIWDRSGGEPSLLASGVSGWQPELLTGLALAGANRPPESLDDGIFTAAEVSALQLPGTELVVLSACQSGLGQLSAGEGMLGLQRAFQKGGAQAVVASLWKVPDAETRALMTEFYTNLWKRKRNKADALRQAQLSLLRPTKGQAAHPITWAAWVISGNPGELPPAADQPRLTQAAAPIAAPPLPTASPAAAVPRQSRLGWWLLLGGVATFVLAAVCLVAARRRT